jgi:hypothetical protein
MALAAVAALLQSVATEAAAGPAGSRMAALRTDADLNALVNPPPANDGRSSTSTLVLLHHGEEVALADGGEGAEVVMADALQPFWSALRQAVDTQRPLRPGTPFLEVRALDKAQPDLFSAFGQQVVKQQVRFFCSVTATTDRDQDVRRAGKMPCGCLRFAQTSLWLY